MFSFHGRGTSEGMNTLLHSFVFYYNHPLHTMNLKNKTKQNKTKQNKMGWTHWWDSELLLFLFPHFLLRCFPKENTLTYGVNLLWLMLRKSLRPFCKSTEGAPRWLSQLKSLPSTDFMVPGSWDWVPHRVPCSAESPFLPVPLLLPLLMHVCSVK